jgi:hypothetical protein
MFCSICLKNYKNTANLKIHYSSAIHKKNLSLRVPTTNNIPNDDNSHPGTSKQIIQQQSIQNQLSNNTTQTQNRDDNIPTLDSIIDNQPENNIYLKDQQSEIIKYVCGGCEKEYAQGSSLYRHRQKCNYYKEAIKLANTTQIDVKTASKLIKRRNLSKCIPQLKLDQELDNFIPLGNTTNNITNNNTTTNNNNTTNNTINNVNIMVGNWETLDFIRPFLHEYIEHLYTRENRIKIISSGNNAANTVIDLVYEMPQNKNIYRYNSRRNFVKTLDINGEIVSFPANEAFGNLAFGILNITDDIMTNSEDILAEFPQYRRGVEAYALTNNWNGESGNERYPEYSRKIEIKVETSHRTSEANITRFENAKQRILSNGGILDFNKHTLKNKPYRPVAQIQQTISALKEKFLAQHI